MYFVLLAAAIAILAGVVVVAMGRGGEIARSHRDTPVRPPRIRTAADVAMLRLPVGFFGYQEEATDAALDAAARLIAEQQAEIARLRAESWRLRPQPDPGADTRPANETRQDAMDGGAAQRPPDAGSPAAEAEVLPSPDPVGGQT